jgi:hypothetical protein
MGGCWHSPHGVGTSVMEGRCWKHGRFRSSPVKWRDRTRVVPSERPSVGTRQTPVSSSSCSMRAGELSYAPPQVLANEVGKPLNRCRSKPRIEIAISARPVKTLHLPCY